VQKFTPEGQFIAEWGYVPTPPPPRPRLVTDVPKKTDKGSAVFRFSSRKSDASFQCRLRGRSVPAKLKHWRGCSSPQHYRHLRPGPKTFEVRAVADGHTSRPARHAWVVLDVVPQDVPNASHRWAVAES
jgi:hypothetical protein